MTRDFLGQLGLEDPHAQGITMEKANESVSAEGMVIPQKFCAMTYPDRDDEFRPSSHKLVMLIQRALRDMPPATNSKGPVLREAARAMALAAAAQDARRLRDELGFRFLDDALYMDALHEETQAPAITTGADRPDHVPSLHDIIHWDPDQVTALYSKMLEFLLAKHL